MALSEEQKQKIAEQLAEKRRIMGDNAFKAYLAKVEQTIPQRQQEKLNTITEDTSSTKKLGGVTGFLGRITGTEKLGRGIAAVINTPVDILNLHCLSVLISSCL